MSALEEDYLTVNEAARRSAAAPSTVRRWIRDGDLPAYRVGKRRVAPRRSDVAARIVPIRPDLAAGHYAIYRDAADLPKLTPEDVKRGLEALERAEQHFTEISLRRGGKPLRPTLDIIYEMRDERTRELE